MKLIENVIFSLCVLSLLWYLVEKVTGFHISGNIPLPFIGLFLWGVLVLVSYFAKSEMQMTNGWYAPAGELNVPARWRGAIFGIFMILFTLYGYFAGWKS